MTKRNSANQREGSVGAKRSRIDDDGHDDCEERVLTDEQQKMVSDKTSRRVKAPNHRLYFEERYVRGTEAARRWLRRDKKSPSSWQEVENELVDYVATTPYAGDQADLQLLLQEADYENFEKAVFQLSWYIADVAIRAAPQGN